MHKSADSVATAEPVGLPPKQAARMGVGGLTAIYSHLKAGRLTAYKIGRSTYVTVESIRALAAQSLTEAEAPKGQGAGLTAAAVAARRAKHAAKLAGHAEIATPEAAKPKLKPKLKLRRAPESRE
jgi:hypothetical protein